MIIFFGLPHKGRNERETFHKHIYYTYNTYKQGQSIMQFTGKKSKTIRPTKAMFKHLTSFYFTDWRHKHTYKSPKKRKPPFLRPVNLLRHSPRPHSQVHLRPPAAPPVRVSHQQAAPGHERGNERGGRERESSLADQPSRGESIREEK